MQMVIKRPDVTQFALPGEVGFRALDGLMIRLLNVYGSRSGFFATPAWRGQSTKQHDDLVLCCRKLGGAVLSV